MATVYHELGVEDHRGRADGPADPGRRSGHRPAAAQAHRESSTRTSSSATKVTDVEAGQEGPRGHLRGQARRPQKDTFDKVLVAVGRRPNGKAIGAEAAGVEVDEQGFIPVDRAAAHQRPPHLRDRRRGRPADARPQGDPRGQGRGRGRRRQEQRLRRQGASPRSPTPTPRSPGPGVTETEAKRNGVKYGKGSVPLGGLGPGARHRAPRGPDQAPVRGGAAGALLGAGIVGPNAGDLIAEVGARDRDGRGRRGHRPHRPPAPDAVGDVAFSAEAFEGTLTDLYLPKRQ